MKTGYAPSRSGKKIVSGGAAAAGTGNIALAVATNSPDRSALFFTVNGVATVNNDGPGGIALAE